MREVSWENVAVVRVRNDKGLDHMMEVKTDRSSRCILGVELSACGNGLDEVMMTGG